jgi:hypothetical protein
MEILTVYLKATTEEVTKYQHLVRKAKCVAVILCVWFRKESAGLRRVVFLPQVLNGRYSGLHVALTGDKTSLEYFHIFFECKLFKVEATALQTKTATQSNPRVDHERFMWQTAYYMQKSEYTLQSLIKNLPKSAGRSERKKQYKPFYQLFRDENEFNSLNAIILEKHYDLENHKHKIEGLFLKDRETVKISVEPPTDVVPRDLPYYGLFGKFLMLGHGLDGYFFRKLFYV